MLLISATKVTLPRLVKPDIQVVWKLPYWPHAVNSPVLFNLCINDLPNVVQFSSVESYVDDTKIFSCPSRLRMLTSPWKESLKTSVLSSSGAAQLNCWAIAARPNSWYLEPGSFWRKSEKLVTWVFRSMDKSSFLFRALRKLYWTLIYF